jgi:hypothetical protein
MTPPTGSVPSIAGMDALSASLAAFLIAADPLGPSESNSAWHRENASDVEKRAYLQALCQWAIQDSNLGPLPYQRSALTN